MDKINVVLVILNHEALEETLEKLNLDNVNLVAIVIDGDSNEKTIEIGNTMIPRVSFVTINKIAKNNDRSNIWVLSGQINDSQDRDKMKKFLTALGIPKANIVDLETSEQIDETWLANLRHIEEHGADFFATGNEYTQTGLNMKYIPRAIASKNVSRGGVNLADSFQDLWQGYLTAKYVFAHVEPGTIKFVLIGLTPDSFRYDNDKDLANKKNLQHFFALKNLLSKDAKDIFSTTQTPDPNFDSIRAKFNHEFSAKSIADWETPKTLPKDSVEANIKILKDYIGLCLKNKAKPVGVVFPFASAMRKYYDKELLNSFRETIAELETSFDFMCVDMFELNLNYESFSDMTHLNSKGTLFANALLSLKLYNKNLLPLEPFCYKLYSYFNYMSQVAPNEEYMSLIERVFDFSLQKLRKKDKIKIGFVLYDSSMWCGDDLYNLFAKDERFEPTVFLCQRREALTNNIMHNVFLRDIDTLKSHGLNLVVVEKLTEPVPAQDVLIFLTPYTERTANTFAPWKLTVKTLITHIIYSLAVSVRDTGYYKLPIFRIVWKIFFPSIVNLKMYGQRNPLLVPRSLYSGYPRIDVFYKNPDTLNFTWKMTRPDAKKIIWAPHHSINQVTKWATFQWNYKFMYEFAKAHPEISWVVKPHPNLAFRAIQNNVFPSVEAFEEYLQAWNALPNAQVYTGAYYQAIFATSDGMIHDCGSFTAEYQYVNKPMIYLTRKGTKFNELGTAILKASYLVDGKDFEAIAAMIQRIFIEGDDYKAAERKEVFDEYLNYPKVNDMLASEFIYKSIADDLQAPTD